MASVESSVPSEWSSVIIDDENNSIATNLRNGGDADGENHMGDSNENINYVEIAAAKQPSAKERYAEFKSSFEKDHWADANPVWRKYPVPNPRLPTPSDDSIGWDVKNFPPQISKFQGTSNREIKDKLIHLVVNREWRNIIVHGNSGSGKSAIINTFCKEFYVNNVEDGRISLKDCTFSCVGNDVTKVGIRQWTKEVEKWMKKIDHKVKKTGASPTMKCILIDDLDHIPPKDQQLMRQLFDALDERGARFVCSCKNIKKLVAGIKGQAYILPMRRLPEIDVLHQTLKMCVTENIGYEKGAIQALFQYSGSDMGKVYKTLQAVFVKYAYLSWENMIKITNPELANIPKTILAQDAINPIAKCEKCTLVPPCQHISAFDLAEMGRRRRRELPRRDEDSMVCTRFAQTGCCKTFNEFGHCSLNHPLDIHSIVAPVQRCVVCSLPKPCGKCEYYKRRMLLSQYVEEKKSALGSYKGSKMNEILMLSSKKMAAASAAHQKAEVKEKIKERSANCKSGIDKLEIQLEQIQGWLRNNGDCIDSQLYKNKTKWINNNVDAAFYAIDRTLEEWRSKRDKEKVKGEGTEQ